MSIRRETAVLSYCLERRGSYHDAFTASNFAIEGCNAVISRMAISSIPATSKKEAHLNGRQLENTTFRLCAVLDNYGVLIASTLCECIIILVP